MIDAVVLAGRPNEGALRQAGPVRWEAMLEIAGRPMIAYVVEALHKAAGVGRIIVVGPEEIRPFVGGMAEIVTPGDGLLENLRRGLAAAGALDGFATGGLLLAGGDIPLITGRMVDDFLAACRASRAAFYYPIIRKEDCLARFPDARRTYVAIREGVFTGGNLFYVERGNARRLLDLAGRFYAARKSPLRLAGLLGWGTLVKVLFKRASIPELETVFARLAGAPAKAVVVQHPEIGMDVDKPEDLKLAEAVLAAGKG